uniref:Uncharacterized protein n=1 Tax=Trichogramma kaykai TaxID=54128 RepID=A0ABD2W3I4_9HYME
MSANAPREHTYIPVKATDLSARVFLFSRALLCSARYSNSRTCLAIRQLRLLSERSSLSFSVLRTKDANAIVKDGFCNSCTFER